MCDIDSQTHVGEVEAVAQCNQRQTDDVVTHQLLEVLPRLLHAKNQDNSLLGPVGGLEEIVELEERIMGLVREVLIHTAGVEVPDRSAAHDVHASGTENAKVQGSVHLLHVASLLSLGLNTSPARHRPEDLLHDELAGEGENDCVEGNKGNIPGTLAILWWLVGIRDGQAVGQEDEMMDRIALSRVQSIEEQEGEQDDQREYPGVLHNDALGPAKQRAGLAPLGETLGGARETGRGLLVQSAVSKVFDLVYLRDVKGEVAQLEALEVPLACR